ncbi:efflux RND transporter permease subunit [Pseudaestuariivita sp.]|uniref:efflux RND transporter permease subunit n=1 Tax=Pseudaestuariivita sp. TaxID=2211669 RepID=UPI0040598CAE
MTIARLSIERPLYTWIVILTCLLGGLWGFMSLGRLEDPAFTIKTAVVITQYPGASAQEVAREVTEPLESEIQKMAEVDQIRSVNQPGLSRISVDMKDTYGGDELPRIWSKLRNRVGEARLPQGTSEPFVNDSFGDVYGIYYAITAPGYTDSEIYQLATFLRRELLAVPGVADVALAGVPNETIYVEPDPVLSTNLGVSMGVLQQAIATANEVVDAGVLQDERGRTLIQRPEGSDSVEEIAGLAFSVRGNLLNVRDVAEVRRAREANPTLIIRHNGRDAFTLGVAGVGSENIVDVGYRVDAKLAGIADQIPLGVQIHPIYQQHLVVEEASNDFIVNLAMSVAIVVAVLAVAMGWRAAVVVGSTLLLTVVGTLLFMWIFSIEMERISLGALIIAMGMLVDNAIVVAEGMQVAMQRGKKSREAADEAAAKTQIPLLGATVIAIMAFAGIGLSPDSTGEFMFSLFAVIGISLVLSWVLALTVTPMLGHYFFKVGQGGDAEDAYGGPFFRLYAGLLRACLKLWWAVIPALVGVTIVCLMAFGQVKQQFFPDSNTPLFFVHYKLAQGASIHETSRDLFMLEDWLTEQPDVVAATAFVGQGASRFQLTYQAEDPNPSYGHIIVRTETLDKIAPLIDELGAYADENLPQGELRAKRLAFGPGGGDPIQVRFSGPDAQVLRELANEAIARLEAASDNIVAPRTDWREMEQVLRPIYATDRAQEAGISRSDITETLHFATTGLTTGVLREGERQIPIILRSPPDAGLSLTDQVIYSDAAQTFVPFDQVTDGMRFEGQNTLIMRRDRVPTITVGADVTKGMNAATVQAQVQETIDTMPVPPGYRMEWGGEYENSRNSQANLAKQLPLSGLIMVLISVLLFNALRQPLIIWLLVPMSICGVSIALLASGLPFSFTALLGLLSLSGMLIKNGIVLVEEIDIVREESPAQPLKASIVEACTSRLRPVILAAATTILGMIPLLGDAFFQSMAATIMGGLAFASILTLIAAPVFYYVFFMRSRSAPAPETAHA